MTLPPVSPKPIPWYIWVELTAVPAGGFALAHPTPLGSAVWTVTTFSAVIWHANRRYQAYVEATRRKELPTKPAPPRPALEEPTPMAIEPPEVRRPPIRVKAYTVEPRQRELTASRRELPGADQRPVLRG